eukprot:9530400-Prorocentrum_lima.AAC.1
MGSGAISLAACGCTSDSACPVAVRASRRSQGAESRARTLATLAKGCLQTATSISLAAASCVT